MNTSGTVEVANRSVELTTSHGHSLAVWGVEEIALSFIYGGNGRGVARIHFITRHGEVSLTGARGERVWTLGGELVALRAFGLDLEPGMKISAWEVIA